MGNVIFITGTDTGAGKTLLTALLLHHLRETGCHALAMKPFCSGGKADLVLLNELQSGELPPNLLNPYFFKKPLAPLVAARAEGRNVSFTFTMETIRAAQDSCDILLVEGAGGILVPIGDDFFVADVISELKCPVFITAQNRLGVLNHSLLSVQVLKNKGIIGISLVLMAPQKETVATRTNPSVLSELISPLPLLTIPFLGANANCSIMVRKQAKKLKKVLARCLNSANLFTL